MSSKKAGPSWVRTAFWGGLVLFASCARPVGPTGGPRDMVPPMVASTWPDTFATIEATRDPAKIAFSERISERPTEGSLNQAVLVSPFTGEHRVKHTRSGLEIDVIGGFQPDLVYRIRLLPTLKDLFNNTMEGPFELVFSTGAPYETNVVAGIAKDRITGEAIEGVRVQARDRGVEDPPVYVAATDSSGVFALRYLPAGAYDIALFEDVNRNREADYRELQGEAEPPALGTDPAVSDTVILREVMLLRPDTIPSRLIAVEALDSLLVRIAFDDYMDAEGSLESVQVVIAPPLMDSLAAEPVLGDPIPIERLMWPRQVDSLQAVSDSVARAEQLLARTDSLQALADTLGQLFAGFQAAGDTLGVDSVGARLEVVRGQLTPPEPPPEAPGPEEPAEPPPILPQQEFFVRLAEPLVGNQAYRAVVSGVENINGVGGGGGEASFSWEPPEPPPEEVPDTATALPDTLGVPPDTGAVAPPDTGSLAPGILGQPRRRPWPAWLRRPRP